MGDIYPESCKVYHRGYDCVSYNQHPSRWKLRRGGVNEVLFGYSRDFPFQLTKITVVLRTRTYIFQGRNVNKYLLKNMERMYRLCKESLWIRSEISENCFHSVVVKIILINYDKKKNLFVPGLVGKHNMDKLERICSDWARKSLW